MKLLAGVVFLLLVFRAEAQLPHIKSNFTLEDQNQSVVYKIFSGKYDFVIAYTAQSYWWSNKYNYDILAKKGGVWFNIRLNAERKNGNWPYPKIKTSRVEKNSFDSLIDTLTKQQFWTLNIDSLSDQRGESLFDATNYRFEILEGKSFRIIESYAPEYFLNSFPDMLARKSFIKSRDAFVKTYKTYCD